MPPCASSTGVFNGADTDAKLPGQCRPRHTVRACGPKIAHTLRCQFCWGARTVPTRLKVCGIQTSMRLASTEEVGPFAERSVFLLPDEAMHEDPLVAFVDQSEPIRAKCPQPSPARRCFL